MYTYTMYILIYHSFCPNFAIFITKWSKIVGRAFLLMIHLIRILGDPLCSPQFCIFINKDGEKSDWNS